MGKQKNNPIEVSQEQYDKDLDDSLNILIEQNSSDTDIDEFVTEYKNNFIVSPKIENSISPNSVEDVDVDGNPRTSPKYRGDLARSVSDIVPSEEDYKFDSLQARKDQAQKTADNISDEETFLFNHFRENTKLNADDIAKIDKELDEFQSNEDSNDIAKNLGFVDRIKVGFENVFGSRKEGTKLALKLEKDNKKTREQLISETLEVKRADYFNELDSPTQRNKILNAEISFKHNTDADLQIEIRNKQNVEDKLIATKSELNSVKKQREDLRNLEFTNKSDILEARELDETLALQQQDALKNYKEDYSELLKKVEKIDSLNIAIGTFDDEINLAKKNYQSLQNAVDIVDIGFQRMANGIAYRIERIDDAFADARDYQESEQEAKDNNTDIDKEALKLSKEERKKTTIKDAQSYTDFLNRQSEFLEPKQKFENISNPLEFVDFATDSFLEQVPVLTQFSMGGLGQSLFFIDNQANNELNIRKGVDDRRNELSEINSTLKIKGLKDDEIKKLSSRKKQLESMPSDIPDWKIYTSSIAMTGVELLTERIGGDIAVLNRTKRVFKSIGKGEIRNIIKKRLTTEIPKILVKNIGGEIATEELTTIIGNVNDIDFLGIKFDENGKAKTYLDGMTETFQKTLGSTSILTIPNIAGAVLKHSSTKKRRNIIAENVIQIEKLYEDLQVEGLDVNTKDIIWKDINNRITENGSIMNLTLEEVKTLSKDDNITLQNIASKEVELTVALQDLTKRSLSSEKSIISTIENQLSLLDKQKSTLLEKSIGKPSITLNGKEVSKTDIIDFINNPENSQNIKDGTALIEIKNDLETTKIISNKIEVINTQPQQNEADAEIENTTTNSEFINELADINDNVEDLTDLGEGLVAVEKENAKVIIKEVDNSIILESVETIGTEKGKGNTRKVLKEITDIADNQDKDISLKVVPKNNSTTVEGLEKLYEGNGFVKDKNYTDNKKMVRKSQQENQQEVFSKIDNLKNEIKNTKKEKVEKNIPVEDKKNKKDKPFKIKDRLINNKLYNIEFKNGKLDVKVKFGKKKPSKEVENKAIEIYLKENDFNTGNTANFDGATNLTLEQEADIVASESQNAQEVARTLININEQSKDKVEVLSLTKEDAIAQALKGKIIDKSNHNQFTDLSRAYRFGRNKEITTIDKIREGAEGILLNNVEFQDVLDFIDTYSSVRDYADKISVTSESSALEVKFEKLTGLKPKPEFINAVANNNEAINNETTEETTEDNNNDVPFQVDKENKLALEPEIQGKVLKDLVNRLLKTGLAKRVEVLNNNEIGNLLENIGVKNVNLQENLSENKITITPNGFVYDNIVYLNSDKVKKDTPIHEFGHLWNSFLKNNKSKAYNEGLKLVEGTKYHNEILNNTAYNHLNEEQKLEEALAQAIGDSGAKILSNNKSPKFLNWLNRVFKLFAETLGVRNIENFKNITLKQYTDLVAVELLKGDKIGNFNTNPTTEKSLNSIDKIMAVQDAVFKAKTNVLDTVNDKNAVDSEVKKALIDYINVNINRYSITENTKGDLNKLLKIVSKKGTDASYRSALPKIDKIVDKLNKKEFASNFKKLKQRNLLLNESKGKKENIKLKRKLLQDYLKSVNDKKWLSNISASNIVKLTNLINDASTTNSVLKAMREIDKLSISLETKYNLNNARNEHKKRLVENMIKEKKKSIIDIRKAVRDYINDGFNNIVLKTGLMSKSEFKKIINSTDTATIKQLEKAMVQIDNVIVSVKNKKLIKDIDLILEKGLSKVQSGKLISGSVSQEALNILTSIRDNISITSSRKLSQKVANFEKRISELEDAKYNILFTDEGGVSVKKENLTEQDLENINTIDLSLKVIEAKKTNDVFLAHTFLSKAFTDLQFIKEEGKSQLIQEKKFNEDYDNNIISDAIYEVDADNFKETDEFKTNTFDQLKQKQSKKYNKGLSVIKNLWKNHYTKPVFRNLSSIINKIKKNPIKSSIIVGVNKIIEEVNLAQTIENQIRIDWAKQINDIKKSVYKKRLSVANFRLTKTFEVKLKKESSDGEIITYENISLTKATLLNVWLKSKDKNNLKGLEKSGYSTETLSEIDKLLSEQDKEFGNEIFKWYREKYNEINEVYRNKYYRDLPLSEFYSGMLNIDGLEQEGQDFFNNAQSFGSVANGSLKGRRIHDKPILVNHLDTDISRYISQMSTFIAYSKVERTYSKLINNDTFKKVLVMNNKGDGTNILNFLQDHLERYIYKTTNKDQTSALVNILHRNVVVTQLSTKIINVPVQMTSFINGQLSLPTNMTVEEHLNTIKQFPSDLVFIFKNSDFVKQRLGINSKVMVKAFSSVDDNFSYNQSSLTSNDRVALLFSMYSQGLQVAQTLGMSPIKIGDIIGVSGVIPVFTAYKNRISKENPSMSKENIEKEAMKRFEIAVNNTQQGQTDGTKSQVQQNKWTKLAVSFLTTVLLNSRETMKAFTDLKRNGNQLVNKSKNVKRIANSLGIKTNAIPTNTTARNIKSIANFGFLQPIAYVGVRALILGGGTASFIGAMNVIKLFFDDDDDNKTQLKGYTDEEKDIAITMVTGGLTENPFIWKATRRYVDLELLQKDNTFGSALSILFGEAIDQMEKEYSYMIKSKSTGTRIKHKRKMAIAVNSLLGILPSKKASELIAFWDIIGSDKYFNQEEKNKFYIGSSFSSIDFERQKRTGVALKTIIEIELSNQK